MEDLRAEGELLALPKGPILLGRWHLCGWLHLRLAEAMAFGPHHQLFVPLERLKVGLGWWSEAVLCVAREGAGSGDQGGHLESEPAGPKHRGAAFSIKLQVLLKKN